MGEAMKSLPMELAAGTGRPPIYSPENFWDHVEKQEDGCWIWTGPRSSGGYGHLSVGGVRVRASRFSYFLTHGEYDRSKLMCHKCDNPPCVRPDHLFLGTHAENTNDAIRKGRKKGLSVEQRQEIARLRPTHSIGDLVAMFGVSRAAVVKIARKYGAQDSSNSLVTHIRNKCPECSRILREREALCRGKTQEMSGAPGTI
jgi:hypothetical protein